MSKRKRILIAIRTPEIETETRFTVFKDISDKEWDYAYGCQIYYSLSCSPTPRGEKVSLNTLRIRKVGRSGSDVLEKPTLEMYFATSIALKNSNMIFNKKKGELSYVKD